MKPFFACLLALSLASAAHAQTTQTQGQVKLNNLPPAATCFTCNCNNDDLICRTGCDSITDFVARQRCLAACGQTLSTCLSNAQLQQRAQDEQRHQVQSSNVAK